MAERVQLLDYARECVESFVQERTLPSLEGEAFEVPGAVFVTLTSEGELRGCIGRFSWDQPLWQAVRDMAIHAASRDPRFSPVAAEELEGLSFEISVLSVPVLLESLELLEIGRHGLIISRRGSRGVLLPQVASERGWGAEEFLANTCVKAQLPADAWRAEDCEIEVFEALILEEG